MSKRITRRTMLGVGAGLGLSATWTRLLAAEQSRPFKIGICEWSLGARQADPFVLARQIGLDGLEMGLDVAPKPNLREEAVQRQYLASARQQGVEICSLAVSGLNRVAYAVEPLAEQWVEDSIDVMVKLGVTITLVPFFLQGDIKDDAGRQAEVIRRLKKVAPRAEKAGVTLGLENTLSADENMRILDAVGSKAVKVYYDVSNSLRRGYDIYSEIPRLGDRICRFHMKEKGCLLGQGDVDFRKVRAAIDKIGYRGWVVIEEGTVKGRPAADCCRENLTFLRSIFPAA